MLAHESRNQSICLFYHTKYTEAQWKMGVLSSIFNLNYESQTVAKSFDYRK